MTPSWNIFLAYENGLARTEVSLLVQIQVNPPLQNQTPPAEADPPKKEIPQEVKSSRILDEWKANVQLYIHHDNLKQERIRHFLNLQAALLAFVGLSTRQAIEGWDSLLTAITFLSFSIGISMISFQLAYSWKAMDERARKFTLFERKRLRDLEEEWAGLFGTGLSTYTSLGAVLENSAGEQKLHSISPERFHEIRNAYIKDYGVLDDPSVPAAAKEKHVFMWILGFWLFSFLGNLGLLIYRISL
jgi:hypothetical protein